jgi:hypothetical protein
MLGDPARHRLKQRIAHYGMRCGIPYSGLRLAMHAVDLASRPADALGRRRAARRLARASAWAGYIPRQTGYRRFEPNEIPGLAPFLEAGRRLYARHAGGALADRGRNPFHMLLTRADLEQQPVFLATALSAPLLEAAAGYLGTVPRLFYIDLWVTRPNLETRHYNSQLYHLDQPDNGIVSLFLNVFDVAPENGPFTFLPADVSRRVRKATRYDRRSILGDGRLDDAEVFRHCRHEDEVAFVGPAGSGGFVDTSVCLHAGSRCQAGERVVLVIRYMPAYRTGFQYDSMFTGVPLGDNPLLRQIVPAGSASANTGTAGPIN